MSHSLPLSLPCWKTFNPELSSHQLQSALPCSAYSVTLDASLPPVSSSPPLLLPHLVLSVKLPLPVSHVLVPSSCCDLHLWSCSRQCSAYDVATCFDHRVCLVSVSYSPFLLMFLRQQSLMPPAIKRCVNVTAYGMTERHWNNILRFISSDQWNIYSVSDCMSGFFFFFRSVLALLPALFRQYCTPVLHSKFYLSKNTAVLAVKCT